jgi:hypothetical protein
MTLGSEKGSKNAIWVVTGSVYDVDGGIQKSI